MKIKLYILILVFMALLPLGCHKDPPPPPAPTIFYIPQEVKDYCYFKVGTYWIYRDSVTSVLDSVYVYEASQGFDTLPNYSPPGIYEKFDCKMQSSYDGYTYEHWWNATWNTTDPTSSGCFRDKYRPGHDAGETFIFDNPIIIGHHRYWGANVITTSSFWNSFNTFQGTFFNVDFLSQSLDPTLNNGHSEYYISKNVGVIRKENPDSNIVWNLMRSHINQ